MDRRELAALFFLAVALGLMAGIGYLIASLPVIG
jgi:hypothetical protein